MDFRVLGPLEVHHDGVPLRLGGSKQQMLLAYLLLRANRQVSVAELVDALWGACPPSTAVKNVQLYVGRLRRILAVDGGCRLRTVNKGYLLTLGYDELDLARCQQLQRAADRADRQGESELAGEIWAKALTMWRGSPLRTLGGTPTMRAEAKRLTELHMMQWEKYFDVRLESNESREIIPDLLGLVASHPQRERLRFQLMLALYRTGRRTAALATFREGYRMIVDQFGIEPGRELRQLHTAILADAVAS